MAWNLPVHYGKISTGEHRPKRLTPERFIFHYIIPLFAAALLLVVFSYLSDTRLESAQNTIASLGQELAEKKQEAAEYSAKYDGILQSLEDLQTQFAGKEEMYQSLNGRLTQKQAQLSAALEDVSALQKRLDAVGSMWALENRFRAGDLAACRSLCAQMRDAGSLDLLTAEQTQSFLGIEAASQEESGT